MVKTMTVNNINVNATISMNTIQDYKYNYTKHHTYSKHNVTVNIQNNKHVTVNSIRVQTAYYLPNVITVNFSSVNTITSNIAKVMTKNYTKGKEKSLRKEQDVVSWQTL